MNKRFTNLKRKSLSSALAVVLTLSSFGFSFADSATVVTLGANLKPEQKQQMLKYFGVNENQSVIHSLYLEQVSSYKTYRNTLLSYYKLCTFDFYNFYIDKVIEMSHRYIVLYSFC